MKIFCFQTGKAKIFGLMMVFISMGKVMGNENSAGNLEYEIKAEFIRRFTEYVEWPRGVFEDSQPQFNICLVGDGPLTPYLIHAFDGAEIKNKMGKIHKLDGTQEMNQCHILFFAKGQAKPIYQVVKSMGSQPILTIGDSQERNDPELMIHLFVDGSRIRFAINDQVAKEKGLKVSSKLLSLAQPYPRKRR